MRFSLVVIAFALTSCAGNIAGITPKERDAIYATAATLSGHAEYVPLIYGARYLTSAKNPGKNVNP
jgi:hypothetical protein